LAVALKPTTTVRLKVLYIMSTQHAFAIVPKPHHLRRNLARQEDIISTEKGHKLAGARGQSSITVPCHTEISLPCQDDHAVPITPLVRSQDRRRGIRRGVVRDDNLEAAVVLP
jgi:hypothetical protein